MINLEDIELIIRRTKDKYDCSTKESEVIYDLLENLAEECRKLTAWRNTNASRD
jgi:hypothetical protein